LISLAVSTTAAPVIAQTQPHPSSASAEEAAGRLQRARTSRDAGRWSEAEASYKAALDAAKGEGAADKQIATITAELGLCELEQRKYRDAAEHLARSLDVYPSPLDPALRRRLLVAAEKAEAHVGTLYLGVGPPDAEVLIDGRAVPRQGTTAELFLEPGQHTVRARLSGYADAAVTVEAVAGKEHRLSLDLPRVPEKVEEKGPRPAGAPRRRPDPRPVQRDETAGTLRTAGFVAAGAGATLGAALTISAIVIEEDLLADAGALGRSTCTTDPSARPCKDLRGAMETRNVVHGLGLGALIASGVIAGVTASSFWWAPSERSPARVHLVPAVEPRQAGLGVVVVW
jgi:hypothetical protein